MRRTRTRCRAAPLLPGRRTDRLEDLVAWALTFATPIAVLVVIGTGAAAAFGRISWGWAIGAIVGIAVIFGSEQIVAWIRGLFGV